MPKKGEIRIPDYQKRIVAYIKKMGDNGSFTAMDCAKATGVSRNNVQVSLWRRYSRGELDRELVDGVCLYARKDDPKIMMESPGLVAELVWATLKDASGDEELSLPEIVRRIEATNVKHLLHSAVAADLCRWHCLGHLLREGSRRQYRYRLTDAARQLPARPVLPHKHLVAPVFA
ncbi:MAG: hypothetical protein Q7R85_01615 [bacterium]|nr:hypothetical protein [bacterium]